MTPTCELCQDNSEADYILVVGDLLTMEIAGYLICVDHADRINQSKSIRDGTGETLIIKGMRIDDYLLAGINDHTINHPFPFEKLVKETITLKEAINQLNLMTN